MNSNGHYYLRAFTGMTKYLRLRVTGPSFCDSDATGPPPLGGGVSTNTLGETERMWSLKRSAVPMGLGTDRPYKK